MLSKTLVLVQLQVIGGDRVTAGQLYHLFYNASFPWSTGNLGRVIPLHYFEGFYGEYEKLRDAFDGKTALSVLPFPNQFPNNVTTLPPLVIATLYGAPVIISAEIKKRFDRRVRMLQDSILHKEKFYASLLEGLRDIIGKGIYLKDIISPKLVVKMRTATTLILCYSADEIRNSTSVRESIIHQCEELLCG